MCSIPPQEEMKICTFLWVYYGYPSSTYEGMNVEQMRCHCGDTLAMRDHIEADSVAGVPDSGTAHAIGYANRVGHPLCPPLHQIHPHLAPLLSCRHNQSNAQLRSPT